MADLTFREQAAIAAMREEMRDSLDDVRGMPDGYHADITREAWLFADAMEAERQKRTAMGEPAKAEAEARRATLEEVSELLWTMRKSKPVATPVRGTAPGLTPCRRGLRMTKAHASAAA